MLRGVDLHAKGRRGRVPAALNNAIGLKLTPLSRAEAYSFHIVLYDSADWLGFGVQPPKTHIFAHAFHASFDGTLGAAVPRTLALEGASE